MARQAAQKEAADARKKKKAEVAHRKYKKEKEVAQRMKARERKSDIESELELRIPRMSTTWFSLRRRKVGRSL